MQNKNTHQVTRWKQFNSIEALRHSVCDAIVQSANEAIAERGQFLLVLAGGNTPRSIYRRLRDIDTDWSKWHIFLNDDRCLPVDDVERNSVMVRQVWLDHVAIPKSQVFDIPTELGNVVAAKIFSETIKNVGTFDVVICGLGEDGHTASLFPGQPIDNSADAVPVFNAPKPPADRVTMSVNRLNNTREAMFLVTGEGKQEAVNNWRKGVEIPAALMAPANGVDVYCYDVELK
ncbi:MAG: 6-phosphogluconolactonase [Methylotenera sp.]